MSELRTLFLKGFDNSVRARELVLLLENRVGPVKRFDIPPKKVNIAFVQFQRNDLADKALKVMNGFDLGRFHLQINEARFGKDQNIPTGPRFEQRPPPRDLPRYMQDDRMFGPVQESRKRFRSRSPTPYNRAVSPQRSLSPQRGRSPQRRSLSPQQGRFCSVSRSRSRSICSHNSYSSVVSDKSLAQSVKIRELSPGADDISLNDEDVLEME